MIEAVIFDLDGVLIDSGPFWDEAETAVLTKVGVPFTTEAAKETIGLRTDALVEYWHQKHPWQSPSRADIARQIDDTVTTLIKYNGSPKAGVYEALSLCEKLSLPIAVASSSSAAIIAAALEALNIADRFSVVHSAEFEPNGKPHPAVYTNTARKLGIHPRACLAIEDSINGIVAAKRAGMYCIAVPTLHAKADQRYADIADRVIGSLKDLDATIVNSVGL